MGKIGEKRVVGEIVGQEIKAFMPKRGQIVDAGKCFAGISEHLGQLANREKKDTKEVRDEEHD
jgi:hypothetical protein